MGTLPKKRCVHCRKLLSCKGMSEHVRFHCSRNPAKQQRSYSKKICPIGRKSVHEKGLRVHMLTVHTRNQSKKRDVLHQRSAPEIIPTPALKIATRTRDAPRKHSVESIRKARNVKATKRSSSEDVTRNSRKKTVSCYEKTKREVLEVLVTLTGSLHGPLV